MIYVNVFAQFSKLERVQIFWWHHPLSYNSVKKSDICLQSTYTKISYLETPHRILSWNHIIIVMRYKNIAGMEVLMYITASMDKIEAVQDIPSDVRQPYVAICCRLAN